MAYHIVSNAGRAQSEARIDPRPLRTSRSTAHGAQVVWPLDYMGRAIYLLESSSNCNWFFKNLHIAIHYQCRMCSAFHPSVCCGQMARWIKIPIGTKVGLSPGRIVLHGDPAPLPKGKQPQLSAHVYCGQTVAHLSYCWTLVICYYRSVRGPHLGEILVEV